MRAILALILAAGISPALGLAAEGETLATAIEVSPEALYADEGGVFKPVELGQFFSEGDRLMTRENGSLHLALADGSSLVLGPHTELALESLGTSAPGSKSVFELIKGVVGAMVEKLALGSTFELRTAHGVAAVKGTQFEVSAGEEESLVTVQEGEVELADPGRRRVERIPASHRGLAGRGRLERAFRLNRRELGDFQRRWERARMIHGQRAQLMLHFKDDRAALEKFKARRRAFKARSRDRKQADGGGEDAPGRGAIQDRRKAARERFQKAREEIREERLRR